MDVHHLQHGRHQQSHHLEIREVSCLVVRKDLPSLRRHRTATAVVVVVVALAPTSLYWACIAAALSLPCQGTTAAARSGSCSAAACCHHVTEAAAAAPASVSASVGVPAVYAAPAAVAAGLVAGPKQPAGFVLILPPRMECSVLVVLAVRLCLIPASAFEIQAFAGNRAFDPACRHQTGSAHSVVQKGFVHQADLACHLGCPGCHSECPAACRRIGSAFQAVPACHPAALAYHRTGSACHRIGFA